MHTTIPVWSKFMANIQSGYDLPTERTSEYHDNAEMSTNENELIEKATITFPKNVILFGGPGTGKTLILAELMKMRIAHYERVKCDKPLRIIVCGCQGLLMEDLEKKYFPELKDRDHRVEFHKSLENLGGFKYMKYLSFDGVKDINEFLQTFDDSTQKPILFIDELQLKAHDQKQDFSGLSAPFNDLEFFIAVRPQTMRGNMDVVHGREYDIKMPDNPKIMAEQLMRRYRNCIEIRELSLHMHFCRKLASNNMHLMDRIDLAKDIHHPNGGIPLWICRDESFPIEKLLRFVVGEYIETGQNVKIVAKRNQEVKEATEALNEDARHDRSARIRCGNMRLVNNMSDIRGCEDDVVIFIDDSYYFVCHEGVTRARERLIIISM